MKRTKLFFLFYAICTLAIQDKINGQADRNTIRDLMRFYYVARINDASYTPSLLDNAAIMSGTESGPFWTNASMAGAQQLVRRLLKASGSGGDASMQRVAARELRILNRPVKVNLLDDSAANVGAVAQQLYGACLGSRSKAWPCASNMTTSDDQAADCARTLHVAAPARRDAVWAGNVCMGTVYLSGGGDQTFKLSTILHELLHTQDMSDGRAHLFWVGTTNYRYGADRSHFGTEAIPNMASTYQEGAANIIRLLYDQNRLMEMFQWFASNDFMLVEQASHAAGTGPSPTLGNCIVATAPSPDVWLYSQIIAAGIRPDGTTTTDNGGTYGLFRIRNLPARIIAHNEYILAMMGEEYALHVGESKLFNAIQDVNSQLRRASGSGLALFYKSLCEQAIPAGQTLQSLPRTSPARGIPRPYLLPLAYADYFTGYRAQNKNDFKAIFEDQVFMNDWVDLYWDSAKDMVRAAVPITTPNFGNLTDIAIALGVNENVLDQ